MSTLNPTAKPKKFIWVTQDYSGLGFAKHFLEEGNEVILAYKPKDDEDKLEEYNMVGEGIVEKMALDDIFEERKNYKDWYWIFDQNHNYEYSEVLRDEGFSVFGGQELTYNMEHDRNFGTDIVEEAGLDTPPTFEFSSIDEGLAFLEKNPDKAYVFKPDESDGAWATYVPDNEDDHEANEELVKYMQSRGDDGTYILQERIKGLEYNVEVWVYEGTPFFAFCCLESKRKLNKDEGEMVGCSQDIAFTIPLDSRMVQETVMKLVPHFPDYTGFLDMNCLVKDKKNYFLEFCARFGYNAHPNLFWNLAISPVSDILADFMDGRIKNFYKHFRMGFGASISLYIDHPMKALPFEKEEYLVGHFYHFDTYKEDDQYRLAGYCNEVGIVCAHGFSIKESAEECLRLGNKIHYPNHAMRTDLDKTDYISDPQGRYEALNAMNYFDIMSNSELGNILQEKIDFTSTEQERKEKKKMEENEYEEAKQTLLEILNE